MESRETVVQPIENEHNFLDNQSESADDSVVIQPRQEPGGDNLLWKRTDSSRP